MCCCVGEKFVWEKNLSSVSRLVDPQSLLPMFCRSPVPIHQCSQDPLCDRFITFRPSNLDLTCIQLSARFVVTITNYLVFLCISRSWGWASGHPRDSRVFGGHTDNPKSQWTICYGKVGHHCPQVRWRGLHVFDRTWYTHMPFERMEFYYKL